VPPRKKEEVVEQSLEQSLLEAVTAGRLDDVRRMLEAQPALVGTRGPNGASAILLAVYHRRSDIAAEFEAHGAVLDIFEASALGRVERIEAILAADPVLVSAYAPDGFHPLGLAAFFGHVDAVKALLAAGADVNAASRNPMRVQALHAAAASRSVPVVQALLEAGADPNARQQQGFVPLHESAENDNRAMAELLVAHGADPRLADDSGLTVVARARAKGHDALADWLERAVGD